MADESSEIIETVVRTLRQVAEWMPMSLEELQETADLVERLGADPACCPMCEEIECDDGCPLAAIRAPGSADG
jgi:hypothetical protein